MKFNAEESRQETRSMGELEGSSRRTEDTGSYEGGSVTVLPIDRGWMLVSRQGQN